MPAPFYTVSMYTHKSIAKHLLAEAVRLTTYTSFQSGENFLFSKFYNSPATFYMRDGSEHYRLVCFEGGILVTKRDNDDVEYGEVSNYAERTQIIDKVMKRAVAFGFKPLPTFGEKVVHMIYAVFAAIKSFLQKVVDFFKPAAKAEDLDVFDDSDSDLGPDLSGQGAGANCSKQHVGSSYGLTRADAQVISASDDDESRPVGCPGLFSQRFTC